MNVPVNRLQLAENVAAFDQVGEDIDNGGFVARVKREIRVLPVALNAQAFELVALNADPLEGFISAQGADLAGRFFCGF